MLFWLYKGEGEEVALLIDGISCFMFCLGMLNSFFPNSNFDC